MEAEYFPPKEVVILQNEMPTNLYILVTGAVEIIAHNDGQEKVVGKVVSGEMFGETGVLYNTPQPFTFQTTEISQILRMEGSTLLSIIHANTEDGFIIMNNFYMKLKGLGSFRHPSELNNPAFLSSGGPTTENSATGINNSTNADQVTREPSDIDYSSSGDIEKQEQINNSVSNKNEMNDNLPSEEGQTALHVAVKKGHLEMVRLLLEGGANVNKADVRGCTPKSLAQQQGNKSIYNLLLSHENRRNEHKIEFIEPKTTNRDPSCSTSLIKPALFRSSSSNSPTKKEVKKLNKRVTIHANFHKSEAEKQLPKLIVLPDSLEELLILAGQKFGGHNIAKVVNSENAEIDDLSVIRDGDHLFLLPSDCESRDYNVT